MFRLRPLCIPLFLVWSLLGRAQNRGISPAAKQYLDYALDLMEKNALHSERIDWVSLRRDALERARDAEVPADTYDTIRWTLKRVNKHSFLQLSPEQEKQEAERKSHTEAGAKPASATNFPLASIFESRDKIEGRMLEFSGRKDSYLVVPHFAPRDTADGVKFETDLQHAIAKLDGEHPAGWIIDLRGNDGGNMWPMLAGVGPLLGAGLCGAFHNSDGKNMHWFYHDGEAGYEGSENWNYPKVSDPLKRTWENPRIAVLIDGGTASSGEAIAIAFRGRPNTRFFGEHTMGASTNNTGFQLPDGANMVLTIGVDVDREGKEFEDGLDPDVVVASPKEMVAPEQDQAVKAAEQWLAAGIATSDASKHN
jgi:carboxyl-terminal processing protease